MLDIPSVMNIIARLLSLRASDTTSLLTMSKARAEAVAPPIYFTLSMASMAFSVVSTAASPKLK